MEIDKKNSKQIIVSCETLETRVAFLNKGRLEEYEIERNNENSLTSGSIYLGRIVNLEPSLQAAFVDIGAEKNAFLHYWDMLPASYDMVDRIDKKEAPEKPRPKKTPGISDKIRELLGNKPPRLQEIEKTKRKRQKITVKDIPKLFPAGSELLVQVTKGPIGTKGARVTTNITLPGRYLVLLPYSDHLGLSSKIEDKKERERLRKILTTLDIPEDMGTICRTAGEGRKSIYFKRDMEMLLAYWHQVETQMQNPKAPAIVYQEPTLVERTVRDFLTDEIDEIIVDNEETYKELQTLLSKFIGRKMSNKVQLHKKARPIFDLYGIKNQITDIFKREAHLPSGGHICVDETEALIAIDVNTGKGRARKEQPETILETNMEAAEEVARQLRLRNIGGLVVIDFIDMRATKDRDTLYKHMRRLVKSDSAKTKILPLSRLGLMEMTRQREHESLQNTVYAPCPYCGGKGKVKSVMTMSVEIQRSLLELLKRQSNKKDLAVRIIMHPSVLTRLKNEDASILMELEKKHGKNLSFRADENIHHETFRLVDPETGVDY